MKTFIRIESFGEAATIFHIDPVYICALRENPNGIDDYYVYINTLSTSIRVSREQMNRIKQQLLTQNETPNQTT